MESLSGERGLQMNEQQKPQKLLQPFTIYERPEQGFPKLFTMCDKHWSAALTEPAPCLNIHVQMTRARSQKRDPLAENVEGSLGKEDETSNSDVNTVFDSDLCRVGLCWNSQAGMQLRWRPAALHPAGISVWSCWESSTMFQERKWQNAFRCLAGSPNDTQRQSHTKETWEVKQVTVCCIIYRAPVIFLKHTAR